jgi:hypothetical protein
VDLEATTQAFIQLFNSTELRLKMGSDGRQRAKEVYDWSAIIPQYEALWAEQIQVRMSKGKEFKPIPHPWPARMDPFFAFASYPTNTLTPETMLTLVGTREEALQFISRSMKLKMVDYAKVMLPIESEIQTVLCAASETPKTALQLIEKIEPNRQAFVLRSLVWLMKLGVLKLNP